MPAPRLTNPPPVRVLIVGVRDYDAPWAHPAEGALHDAIGWWRYAVLSLGIAPESIRVLTNPPLGERQLAAGVAAEDPAERAALVDMAARTRRGRATGAAIAKGIDWLRSWDGQQLLTFSGHGIAHPALATTKGASLGVLPAFAFAGSDHARLSVDEYERMFQLWREGENLPGLASLGALQPPLRRVIVGDATQGPPPVDQSDPEVARRRPALTRPDWAAPLGEAIRAGAAALSERVDDGALLPREAGPGADDQGAEPGVNTLTVIIDACFATPVAADATMAAPSSTALAQAIAEAGRGLLSCDVNHTCYTLNFAGQAHGAWSWALQTVLSRWSTQRATGGEVFATITHDELHLRARQLFDTLGVAQRPVLTGLRRVDNMGLLAPDTGADWVLTSQISFNPDEPLRSQQFGPIPLRPFWKIDLVFTEGGLQKVEQLAWLMVPSVTITPPSGSGPYAAGTEYWRFRKSSLGVLKQKWDLLGANPKIRLTLQAAVAAPENGPAAWQWIKDNFVTFGDQAFNTLSQTSFGPGYTTPQTSQSAAYLTGWGGAAGSETRGMELVLDEASPPALLEQRWFWASLLPPSSSTLFYNSPPPGNIANQPKVTAYPAVPAVNGTLSWYTHISLPI